MKILTKPIFLLLYAALIATTIGISVWRSNQHNQVVSVDTEQTQDAVTSDNTNSSDSSTTAAADSSEIVVPEEMTAIIAENQEKLDSSGVIDDVTKTYPENLVPLYDAVQAGDSNPITTENGQPGWTLIYGSASDVSEVSSFYQEYLKDQTDYAVTQTDGSTKISAVVSGWNLSITVSPNNPERTGLDTKSDITVLISQV